MTVEAILALVLAHKWIVLASVAIGAVVRLLKSDTVLPVDVPAQWRPLLALALGQISAVLEHVAAGAPWGTAIAGGLAASVIAILGHEWIVERLLGDRAMPIPGLTKKPSARSAPELNEPPKERSS